MSAQSMQSLELANHVRLTRARYKRGIAKGEIRIVSILSSPPDECLTMSLDELLRAQKYWGRLRTDRFCHHLAIWPYRPLGKLTAYQRQRIIEAL